MDFNCLVAPPCQFKSCNSCKSCESCKSRRTLEIIGIIVQLAVRSVKGLLMLDKIMIEQKEHVKKVYKNSINNW